MYEALREDSLIVYMVGNLHIELLASLFQLRSVFKSKKTIN